MPAGSQTLPSQKLAAMQRALELTENSWAERHFRLSLDMEQVRSDRILHKHRVYWSNHVLCFATPSLPPPRRRWMERQAPKAKADRWKAFGPRQSCAQANTGLPASLRFTEPKLLTLNVRQTLRPLSTAPRQPPGHVAAGEARAARSGPRRKGRAQGRPPGTPPGQPARRGGIQNREPGRQSQHKKHRVG